MESIWSQSCTIPQRQPLTKYPAEGGIAAKKDTCLRNVASVAAVSAGCGGLSGGAWCDGTSERPRRQTTTSEKLTGLRKREGLSQEALAEQLGVSRQAVSRWEQGAALPDAAMKRRPAPAVQWDGGWLDEEQMR